VALATLRKLVSRMSRQLSDLTARPTAAPPPGRLKADPANLMALAGMRPDPWQTRLLRSTSRRHLLCCSRQAGKSQVAAALALREALLTPRSLVLLLSPSLRQSGELFRDKVLRLYNALGRPVAAARETALTVEFANGSRIVSLPGDDQTVRGYSGARLLVLDEAARISDQLYYSVRPMLAVSGGRLIAMSSPFGRRGWFFDEWSGAAAWDRTRITAQECPRISPQFLAEEKASLGERWFRQEYLCSFEEVIDAVFSASDVQAAVDAGAPPLWT
jgi:hypothetical protein